MVKSRAGSTTFVCDKGDYSEADLKQFSINTGSNIIIRRYGKIINGELHLFN